MHDLFHLFRQHLLYCLQFLSNHGCPALPIINLLSFDGIHFLLAGLVKYKRVSLKTFIHNVQLDSLVENAAAKEHHNFTEDNVAKTVGIVVSDEGLDSRQTDNLFQDVSSTAEYDFSEDAIHLQVLIILTTALEYLEQLQ